jgi:O-antigen/teichoic acid export membrane protein
MITDTTRDATPSGALAAPEGPPAESEGAARGAGARRVARNSVLPFAAGLAARVLSWGMAVVMARTLGPAGTGAYYLAANLWLYASIVADFGLGTWLTREVARAPHGAREAVRETLGLRLVLACAAAPLLAGAAALTAAGRADPRIVTTAALLGVGLIPGALSAAGAALFNAHEEMTFPAVVQLGGAALTTILGASCLLLGFDIVALGAVSLLVNVVTAAVFAVACARRFFALGATVRPAAQVRLAHDAVPLMLNNLLNNVFFRIDVQILQAQGSDVVGKYGQAYKVIDAAGAVPSSFVLALFPVLSRRAAGAGGDDGFARVYRLALKLLVAVALPLALVVSFLSADITRWFAGEAFLPDSAVALRILIWFLPLSFFNGLTQYVLIAAGLQRRITVAFAITAAFNLAANLLLIPRYSYVAAGIVTIASEVVLLVPFLLAVRARVPVGPLLAAALRPLPAAAVAAAVLWGVGAQSAPLGVAAGLLLYAALLIPTRVFDPIECHVLAGLIPARVRAAWAARAMW